jgi:hypothetical protein
MRLSNIFTKKSIIEVSQNKEKYHKISNELMQKTKKWRLLFQFFRVYSVYYFSFIKLIVSTFLVYKVKKCLLKSGKVNVNYK